MSNRPTVVIPKPKRWAQAFSDKMSTEKVDWLLEHEPFKAILAEKNNKNEVALTSVELELDKLKREFATKKDQLSEKEYEAFREDMRSRYGELQQEAEKLRQKCEKNKKNFHFW